MSVSAIASAGTSSAETELKKYQDKLAADLAAKAAMKAAETSRTQDHEQVITQDRAAVAKAQQDVQREQEKTRTASTTGYQSKIDVTV
ncbi:F0F1-type ATP synthase assembly protein I [Actinoplanes tereljensis]|uniref:Uncharacterized protein n=1 Tax=Paractinoplanes tereljensis TaxID=571912 RepID=A0A919TR42_9ACTN|nr:hypothetical protein [Actinoplanes tereljensis]GIF17737.1 hypothetical protein Ate02nite_04670 [Actinoplanes tereljensis]